MASGIFDPHQLAEAKGSNAAADTVSERLTTDSNAWTIAIDLKLNLNTETPDGCVGAERKSTLLKKLVTNLPASQCPYS